MLLGTQFILLLVLIKGEICPGQRGRIHQVMPLVGAAWLVAGAYSPVLVVNSILTFYFVSKANMSKTKNKGPLWALKLSVGLATVFVLLQAADQVTFTASIAVVLFALLLGSAGAHLLLTMARTRLQAFHRILPFLGVAVAIVLTALNFIHSARLLEVDEEQLVINTMVGLVLMTIGVLVWCGHIVFSKPAQVWQLFLCVVLLFSSMTLSWKFSVI
ncbi:hypothetical protein M9194_15065 [Vibrio sp. S4M6]|nr:hypothetical protein [Vibrio sinus]MCL9782754.1 hypothetical protein [Vibrio sinus]